MRKPEKATGICQSKEDVFLNQTVIIESNYIYFIKPNRAISIHQVVSSIITTQ